MQAEATAALSVANGACLQNSTASLIVALIDTAGAFVVLKSRGTKSLASLADASELWRYLN